MAWIRLYPPAADGIALYAIFCPFCGSLCDDSILEQAAKCKSTSCPFSNLTTSLSEATPTIYPEPETKPTWFVHMKPPLKLSLSTTAGSPNLFTQVGAKMPTLWSYTSSLARFPVSTDFPYALWI